MLSLLRQDLGLQILGAIVLVAAVVLGFVAASMVRAGAPLRPVAWMAGFMLLVLGPQFAWVLSKAHAERAFAEARWGTAFSPGDAGAVRRLLGETAVAPQVRGVFMGAGSPFAGASAGAHATFPGTGEVLLVRYESGGAVEQGWLGFLAARGLSASARGDSRAGAVADLPDGSILYAAPVGLTLTVWMARDEEAVGRLMSMTGWPAPAGNPIGAGSGGGAVPALVPALLLACYVAFVSFYFIRGVAWAGTVPPRPGTAALDAARLKERLLALDGTGTLSVQVTAAGHIAATWRDGSNLVDGSDLRLSADGTRRLVIVPHAANHVAGVSEYGATRSTGHGTTWKRQYGITLFQARGRPHAAEGGESSERELLVEAVTGAGWAWRPELFGGPVL